MSQELTAVKGFADEDAALDWVTSKQREVVEDILNVVAKGGFAGGPDDVGTSPGKGSVTMLDKSDKTLLTGMLDGIARNALTKKRIKSDEAMAAGLASSATGLIAELLKSAQSMTFGKPMGDVINMPAPQLGKEIPDPVLLPGETEIGVATGMNYESFMNGRKAA